MKENINIVPEKVKFTVGGFTILPLKVSHDVPCYSYLINYKETGLIYFVTDTHHIPYRIPNMNHLLIEANFDGDILDNHVLDGHLPAIVRKRVLNSHLSIEGTKLFLSENDLSETRDIVLLHLSDGNSDSRQFRKEVEELTGVKTYIATKGLSINLDKEPF